MSSTASSRVGCTPTFRSVRGPLPDGDLGAEEADGVEGCDAFEFVGGAVAPVRLNNHPQGLI